MFSAPRILRVIHPDNRDYQGRDVLTLFAQDPDGGVHNVHAYPKSEDGSTMCYPAHEPDHYACTGRFGLNWCCYLTDEQRQVITSTLAEGTWVGCKTIRF